MAQNKQAENVFVVDHPVVIHKLTELRDQATRPERFRHLLRDVSVLLACEATRDLPIAPREVATSLATAQGGRVAVQTVVVPVIRAGLGMADAVREVLPDALEAFVGIYRDLETHEPVKYYANIPLVENARFFVVDPMLATGGTAAATADQLNQKGVSDAHITYLALLAAPEGLARFRRSHPDIPIYLAAIDERLNEHDYIVPGLGDAGDRLFGAG